MNNSPTWGLPIEAPIIPQRYGREHNYPEEDLEEDKHSINEAPGASNQGTKGGIPRLWCSGKDIALGRQPGR